MAGRSFLRRFFGNSVSTASGVAIGSAMSPALEPLTRSIANATWETHAVMPIEPGRLAEGVAKGRIDLSPAAAIALHSGINGENFGHMVRMAQASPGAGVAFDLWRRGVINEDGFREAVQQLGLQVQWIDDLVKIKNELLTPGELAAAIHRGLVPDPGLLQGEQPTGPFKIDAYPVYKIDALKEAAGSGYDHDRLGVMVGLQGLPMGTHEAAQAYFRGIITHGDYVRAFNESNSRNEWAEAVLGYARQIPTARDFLENALRGYSDLQEAIAGAALHGMSAEHATLIYQNQGRPMPVRRITQALARGAKFNPEPGEIKDPYRASIVEGSLKPGYYDMEEAMKYTPPSVFAIRQLASSGVWDEATVRTRLLWLGWFPDDAAEVAKAWTTSGGAATDSHIAKAQTQLWTATHSSYLNREASATVARTKLQQAGVATTAIAQILGIWDHERELIRKGLSPANVKKAFAKGSRNNATGQPWTRDEAIAFLVGLGWSANEANDYLDIP